MSATIPIMPQPVIITDWEPSPVRPSPVPFIPDKGSCIEAKLIDTISAEAVAEVSFNDLVELLIQVADGDNYEYLYYWFKFNIETNSVTQTGIQLGGITSNGNDLSKSYLTFVPDTKAILSIIGYSPELKEQTGQKIYPGFFELSTFSIPKYIF